MPTAMKIPLCKIFGECFKLIGNTTVNRKELPKFLSAVLRHVGRTKQKLVKSKARYVRRKRYLKLRRSKSKLKTNPARVYSRLIKKRLIGTFKTNWTKY